MKMYRAILLLMSAVLLVSCATSGSDTAARKGPPVPSPLAGSGATSASSPREIITDLSPTRPADGEEAKKNVPPSIVGQIQTGLLSPAIQDKLDKEKPVFTGKDVKQKVVLNFEKADVGEVTNVIFQDYLKLSYVLDPALQGRISLYLEGEFNKDELFQMIRKAYVANNLAITPRNGIYYIQPIQRSSSSSLPLADNMILKDEKSGARPVIVMYRLQFMDVKQAINTVKFFLTPGRPITSDSMANTLIFVEDADNARTIVDILRALDINILKEVSMEIVPLQSLAPQDAAQSMEALMSKLDVFKESALKSSLAIIPLQNFGGVLLLAQNPDMLKTAKSWLTALDIQSAETGEQIYVYFVQNGLAKDVGDILNQVFGLKGATSGRPEQQIVSSTRSTTGGGFGGSGFGSRSGGFGSFGGSSGGSGFGRSSGYGPSSSRSTSGSPSSSGSTSGGSGGLSSSGTRGASGTRSGMGGMGGMAPNMLTGEVVIITDEVNNAIVLRANAQDYAKIKKTIEALDIIPRAVLIEVMIAEVVLDKELAYGLEWFFKNTPLNIGGDRGHLSGVMGGTTLFKKDNKGKKGQSTGTTVSDISTISSGGLGLLWVSSAKDIATLITMLASKTSVNILSSPTLLATDNKEATITVGGREPIPTGSVSGTESGGGSNIYNTIQYEQTGIMLNVTPHINAGGLVRLEVEQTTRSVDKEAVIVGNNSKAPTFRERNVKTTLLAQDGSTVIIGGIIEQSDQKDKSGIPYLQDVPIISPLFSTRGLKSKRTELLIAITPHVVDHRESNLTREFVQSLQQLKKRIEKE